MKLAQLKLQDKRRVRGFTLIELLIVIAIIGAISAFVVLAPIGATKKGRDTRRKSDLRQYEAALETYANKNDGMYLSRNAAQNAAEASVCGSLGLSNCPEDPLNNLATGYKYRYLSDGTGGGLPIATKFILWTKLEATVNSYVVVCSNGKAGIWTSATAPSTADCPSPLN